ncbi:cell wall-binding repeat-containing protein [Euzebya tangerina]|uniref:cell wall-binding repeat-containing protein n=1 Tax=Euzebya tangerina TaxID=591198 RepID=UPI0013C2F91D|nr:cell wall-binding repeat-containing protein [Euzebya tangerina]
MRTRSLTLLIATALITALLAAPAGADSFELRLAGQVSEATSQASDSFAVQGCFTDAEGDTTRGLSGPVEAVPQADISVFCIDYNAGGLDLAVTVPDGTDPNVDPQWDRSTRTSISLGYLAANGEEREVQLSEQNSDTFRTIVLADRNGTTELVCEAPATFASSAYVTNIPAGCLGGGAELEILTQMLYQTAAGDSVYDFVPARGVLLTVPLDTPAGGDRIMRFEGPTRIETANAISQATFADGEADGVLIALARNFPDAVVGAPLAVANNAPLLLAENDSVSQSVRDEALRAMGGPGDVVLLGGTAALQEVVATTLESDGHTVTRAAGDSRFSTSVEVARQANPAPETIVLVFGGDFPEALLAGAIAPGLGGVAVLVDRGGVPSVVQDYLDANPDARTFALGTVADEVVPDADTSAFSPTPSTLSSLLLQLYPEGSAITMASSEEFPDGLAGGAYAARNGLPLILSPESAMETLVLQELSEFGPVPSITMFGGNAALSDTVAGQASSFLQ